MPRLTAVALVAVVAVAVGSLSLSLIACNGDNRDPNTSASSGGGGGGGGGGGPVGNGPLANLESAPFLNEVWKSDDGQNVATIYYASQNVRMSSQCRTATGQLACEAIRYLRSGTPVQIPRRELSGNMSAGVKACMRLNLRIVTAHNSVGAEDSFCAFPDGSLLATGSLEQYGMRIME